MAGSYSCPVSPMEFGKDYTKWRDLVHNSLSGWCGSSWRRLVTSSGVNHKAPIPIWRIGLFFSSINLLFHSPYIYINAIQAITYKGIFWTYPYCIARWLINYIPTSRSQGVCCLVPWILNAVELVNWCCQIGWLILTEEMRLID